jgi:hypothetical protein
MSEAITLEAGGLPPGFTVNNICGCRIVYGPVPMSEVGMLTHGFSNKALMDVDLASRIGATLVIGEPGDLEDLRWMDLPISDERRNDSHAASHKGLDKVASWLADGERGRSSNAMCKRIFGIPENADDSHPYDPADLRRCLLFLDATDARDKVSLMSDVSEQWGRLVARWDELTALFESEYATGNRAPQTYALMKEILKRTLVD